MDGEEMNRCTYRKTDRKKSTEIDRQTDRKTDEDIYTGISCHKIQWH